ncbi:MAG: hypothetical protein IPP03_08240 [Dechloromonas sp.]|jgi:hypothetical protein|nr:hypothetical protein [Candidatus Dechloromonas phosphoritropha]MBP8787872.1 hypothetical protein [Azonexus sp.]
MGENFRYLGGDLFAGFGQFEMDDPAPVGTTDAANQRFRFQAAIDLAGDNLRQLVDQIAGAVFGTISRCLVKQSRGVHLCLPG